MVISDRKRERRQWGRPSFPLRDSDGIWVTRNRRRVVDRRGDFIGQDRGPHQNTRTQSVLTLHHRDRVIEIPIDSPAFTLGRHSHNSLRIVSKFVSRDHARIECRRGRFVLIDSSRNGTLVALQSGQPVHVKHDELQLSGSGVISLGRQISAENDDLIHFVCT